MYSERLVLRSRYVAFGPKAARRANRKAGTQNRRSHQAAVRGNCSESRRPWVYSTEERGAISEAFPIDQRGVAWRQRPVNATGYPACDFWSTILLARWSILPLAAIPLRAAIRARASSSAMAALKHSLALARRTATTSLVGKSAGIEDASGQTARSRKSEAALRASRSAKTHWRYLSEGEFSCTGTLDGALQNHSVAMRTKERHLGERLTLPCFSLTHNSPWALICILPTF